MREAQLQNMIRLKLAEYDGLYFRANVGQAWTGDSIKHQGSQIIINNGRPFNAGLPKGFSDLFGVTPVLINESHIGQTIGVATFLEVKVKGNKPSENQKNFIKSCKKTGAIAEIVYNVSEAINSVNASR